MNHEEATVRAFVIPNRQERYLTFLSNPKRRAKFIAELAHFKALNFTYAKIIPAVQQNATSVAKLLTSKGAGRMCWVISEDSILDARQMDLETALQATIGRGMGTIISCVPGRLAYFEDEDGRYILER
jgi:hypothetical protein